jgi:16S rRNA (cytosine1402-N4)-methyltransferase
MKDGPLDMRMNPETGISAADWLASASIDEMTRVLKEYGEEKFGRRIATAIAEQRETESITTTQQLVEIIQQAIPVKDKHKHPATRSFQGIRIFINRELDDLTDFLSDVIDLLKVGGRLVVISFHSLEDRMIKRFMRDESRGKNYPAGMPVTEDMLNRRLKVIGKAIKPGAEEISHNSRARSAVMRVAEKIA